MTDYCFSELECKIICAQIERRAKYRKEFLKLRTDPCLHSKESGYVFDPAMQRFMSMKCTQFEHFTATKSNVVNGILFLIPFFVYGYAVWSQRSHVEREIRCGRLKYRDRLFKLQ
ncbi:uncharacterized protein LOC106137397 [Amyelois transitella]|uniref:uncharacterized protein LOC106137397 n=1 Tax=Amyelois transitella TaxID=680683 RepID=UPI00067B2109|nr:uncharacterized protein LOC106137397 [Amyelois transitella]